MRYPLGPFSFFLGGIAAALLAQSELFCRLARKKIASVVSLCCIVLAFTAYPSALGFAPLLLLSVAFTLIAAGNTLFGALTCAASRTLGEVTYSIYLLHGITLFVTFNFIIGLPGAKLLSPITHWLVIIGLTPFLVLLSYAAFRLIEAPAMQHTAIVTAWIRSRLAFLPLGTGFAAGSKEASNDGNTGC